MIRKGRTILFMLMILGVAGLLIMVSGIIPVGSSGGHWALTEWILHFSMERSISTHSLGTKIPSFENEKILKLGAAHYEIGCRQCHGGFNRVSVLGNMMTPVAPFLPDAVKKWKPRELFQIVKHGVKFTGMPYWPDLRRDDEVWAMVAFLKKLPELNEVQFEKLTKGEISHSPNKLIRSCSSCHGNDGNGRPGGVFPKLAEQRVEYLADALRAYATGERSSGTMRIMAATLSEEMIQEISQHYGRQKRVWKKKQYTSVEWEGIKRGESIARKGIPGQHVGACMGCHGPDSLKSNRNPHFPILAGQPAEYLVNQLELFFSNKRGGAPHVKFMKKAVHKLTKRQIEDVSIYYESLPMP